MKRKSRLTVGLLTAFVVFTGCAGSVENIPEEKPTETVIDEPKENVSEAYPPCVMIDGIVYKDTGYNSSMLGCGTMDGSITSSVDETQLPTENDQSNFGEGYDYQRGTKDQVLVVIDDEWRIFRNIESEDDSIPEQVINFTAKVKEIRNDGNILVSLLRVAEGFAAMEEGDYVVSAENIQGEIHVGDTVTIWFNGNIMETYPAQIGLVYRIEK